MTQRSQRNGSRANNWSGQSKTRISVQTVSTGWPCCSPEETQPKSHRVLVHVFNRNVQYGHIDQGALMLEGKVDSSLWKSSHKKRLQLSQPQLRDADRHMRSKEESNTRVQARCWNYLVLTALWRKTNVSDVQTSLKREHEVILSSWESASSKQLFWKATILTSSAKFWFTSCIKLSSLALGEGSKKENVTSWKGIKQNRLILWLQVT